MQQANNHIIMWHAAGLPGLPGTKLHPHVLPQDIVAVRSAILTASDLYSPLDIQSQIAADVQDVRPMSFSCRQCVLVHVLQCAAGRELWCMEFSALSCKCCVREHGPATQPNVNSLFEGCMMLRVRRLRLGLLCFSW